MRYGINYRHADRSWQYVEVTDRTAMTVALERLLLDQKVDTFTVVKNPTPDGGLKPSDRQVIKPSFAGDALEDKLEQAMISEREATPQGR